MQFGAVFFSSSGYGTFLVLFLKNFIPALAASKPRNVPVKIFRACIPHNIGSAAGTRTGPILNFGDFAASAVASVLVLPGPIDATDDSSPRKNASDGYLFALAPTFEKDFFVAHGGNTIETMPEVVLVLVVTYTAQVVADAFGAFPTNAENGILSATIALGAIMFRSRRSRI